MMALSAKEPFNDPDWIFETKLDGYRAIAVIDSTGKARIWSRNRLPLEPKFPDNSRCDRGTETAFNYSSNGKSVQLLRYASTCSISFGAKAAILPWKGMYTSTTQVH